MTLTREQTDQEMLEGASSSDNQNTDYMSQTILNRGTESTHPKDCQCLVCIRQKYLNTSVNEVQVKESLNYFVGDADS